MEYHSESQKVVAARPVITVAIPVCGRTAFLETCLSSVVASDPGDGSLEVLVLDNASDNVEEFAAIVSRFPGVRLLRFSERAPVSGSFNRCLSAGTGPWIHILHDDDAVEPEFYGKVLVALQAPDARSAGLLACDTRVMDENDRLMPGRDGGISWPLSRLELLHYSLGSSPFYCPAVLISRKVAEAGIVFDETYHVINDWEYWWRVMLQFPVAFAPGAVARYRIHQANTHKSEKHHRCYRIERPRLIDRQIADADQFRSFKVAGAASPAGKEYRQRARRILHTVFQRQIRLACRMFATAGVFGYSRALLAVTMFQQGVWAVLLLLGKERNAYYTHLESCE